jgi:hypothetical protein
MSNLEPMHTELGLENSGQVICLQYEQGPLSFRDTAWL